MLAAKEFRPPVEEARPYPVEIDKAAHNFRAVDRCVNRGIRKKLREYRHASFTTTYAEQPIVGNGDLGDLGILFGFAIQSNSNLLLHSGFIIQEYLYNPGAAHKRVS